MTSAEKSIEAATKRVLVWDLPVRIFHWTLLLAIVGAFITNQLGVVYFRYHLWFGYTVLVLVAFRLVWGLIGTRHARFWNFVRGPVTTVRYTRDLLRGRDVHYAGHNPLGALMVVVLLGAIFAQAATGLFGNDEIFNVGPLYGYVTNELSLELTSVHRQLFYWLAGAAAIHILAVLAHWLFKRENLVAAMITGRKPRHHLNAVDIVQSSRTWLAVLLVAVVAVGLAWIVLHAPAPVVDVGY